MTPRTFVVFVPVVKNECVNATGHRRGNLEKNIGAYSSQKMSRSRIGLLKSKVGLGRQRLVYMCFSNRFTKVRHSCNLELVEQSNCNILELLCFTP